MNSLQKHRRRPLERGGLHDRAGLHRADVLLLFLKYLDGHEQDRADEAALELFTIVLHIAFVKSTLLKIKQAPFLGLTRDKRKAQVELSGLFC